MKLDSTEARSRFAVAPVARLATAGADGTPHVVPVTFTLSDDRIFFAIDYKPKSTWNLRRLRNIRENPKVALLVDHFDSDWARLWWTRADGHAEIKEDGDERSQGLELLERKYEQYSENPPVGPVVIIRVDRWSGWAFSE
ncbi:TIGR03668 family PPOX class F420-dependent oxidoreductase [Streptomyces sp. S4.7]|uniref:TIGR03668 family PPOX class F420-dependent oxidoreductase n=1 Tax=Streptomyces sp. S4.7 TaxID=2705439 RepID=UPI0013DD0B73|nr:TIGR03668 family PPOX class F420-dependent oxidoreductase [Streptomyces sp. S4.7]